METQPAGGLTSTTAEPRKTYGGLRLVQELGLEVCDRIHPKLGVPCNVTFNRSNDLERHNRAVHDAKQIPCEKCENTFSRKDALQRHLRSIYREDQQEASEER